MDYLLSLLDLEPCGANIFRGQSKLNVWRRLFGGLILAQAVVAAQKTVEGKNIHSLHGYFLREGSTEHEIDYVVETLRDGRSFATRQVKAEQRGEIIFTLLCSFHHKEEGLFYQRPMIADVPMPETLPLLQKEDTFFQQAPAQLTDYWRLQFPFLFCPVDKENYVYRHKKAEQQMHWFKLAGEPPQDWARKAALLAYLSDMTILDNALYSHNQSIFTNQIQSASLDHALWFHQDIDWQDWLLYVIESPFTGGNRGYSRAFIYDRKGTLVASVAQEGLIREKRV